MEFCKCLLINVTKNEMMLDKQIKDHDPKQSESITLQTYNEIKEQLLKLENKLSLIHYHYLSLFLIHKNLT